MGWAIAVLGMLATAAWSLTIALSRRNRELLSRLRKRDGSLARSLALVDMAERLAGLGRWRAKPDGTAEWSSGLCRLMGFPVGMTPDFATQCEMMPDGGSTFYGALDRHKRDREPFAFEFSATRVDGEIRTLRVIIRNEFEELTGKLAGWQGVALDVTDERQRLDALENDRVAALAQAAESRRLAETDPLTGLVNRRRAMAEADRAALAARDGAPLALVLFDIDHFKAVNDCFGHPTGDAVLVNVARIASETVRAGELVGRIGGEEFLCVLPNADTVAARGCAERLRRAIATRSASDDLPAVTVSVGFATWRKGDSALSLFARADAALYEAKHAGRDCIRLAA